MAERPTPTGATRLAGVIGDPVRHSISPAIHNAAFAACDLDWVHVAFPVAAGGAADAVAAMRILGIDGLSVTMPHKLDIARAVDACTDIATVLGAVNCVFRDGDRLVGDNTDGEGFVRSLAADGVDVEGARVVLLGAGGAARAIAVAVAGAGAADVAVVNRTAGRAVEVASLAGAIGRVGSPVDVERADILVNATSVGMGVDATMPVPRDVLRAGLVVADIVYHPESTPLLTAAVEAGCVTIGGIGMLAHQAARQFTAWTGVDAPVDVMVRAARAAVRGTD